MKLVCICKKVGILNFNKWAPIYEYDTKDGWLFCGVFIRQIIGLKGCETEINGYPN